MPMTNEEKPCKAHKVTIQHAYYKDSNSETQTDILQRMKMKIYQDAKKAPSFYIQK